MGSGCAWHSPSSPALPHRSEAPRYFQRRIIPGGTSPPEPADTTPFSLDLVGGSQFPARLW